MNNKFFCLAVLSFLLFNLSAFAQNDTMLNVRLKEIQVTDHHVWANDTVRYQFNQTKYNVQTILPYLNAATTSFNAINTKINAQNLSRRERKSFVHGEEDMLRTQFEDKIKALNETQGVLLIKLISRQTGLNIYNILSEFKNPLTAIKWQAWARFHGFNINKIYDPADEPLLESVMFSLGYDLPDFYTNNTVAQRH
ncbi:MAG: DUF4294 domain-containing protein [Bacteroidetes bacterium]|nr:DUF4294 domain-containing protein [Bacteroidota bacterium]